MAKVDKIHKKKKENATKVMCYEKEYCTAVSSRGSKK